MKIKLSFLALLFTAPLALLATPGNDAFLLKAKSVETDGIRSIASGGATLTSKDGETRITADEIAFDQASGQLKLTGAVTIQAAGLTIEAKEATLNAHGKRVAVLSNGRISLGGGQPSEIKVGTQTATLSTFSEPYPKTETKLPAEMPKR